MRTRENAVNYFSIPKYLSKALSESPFVQRNKKGEFARNRKLKSFRVPSLNYRPGWRSNYSVPFHFEACVSPFLRPF